MIELAIVLVIIGLLIGGGIAAVTATLEQTRRSDQEGQLETVREAIYGFAMARGHLPCPDTTDPPDGTADGAACSSASDFVFGALPWATLGVGRRDAWGEPLYYAVYADWAEPPSDPNGSSIPLGPPPSSPSPLDVYADAPTGSAQEVAEDVGAVVVSFGPQGGQIWRASGRFDCNSGAPPGFSPAERENCDEDDGNFVDAEFRPEGATKGRFDDLLIWIPTPVLQGNMVKAGRLP